MHLVDILKQFKWSIITALSLVGVENIAWIIEPTLFGNVIDALIDVGSGEKASGTHWAPLFLWISAFLVNSAVGALRRSVDPRIFLTMFTEIATKVSRISTEQGLSVLKDCCPLSIVTRVYHFLSVPRSGGARTTHSNCRCTNWIGVL